MFLGRIERVHWERMGLYEFPAKQKIFVVRKDIFYNERPDHASL